MIVPELRRIQDRHGYLPREALVRLSERTGTPLYRLQEVASFFPHFRLEPPPRVEVLVCRDMSCALRGSRELLLQLQQSATRHEPSQLVVQGTSCLGRCDRAPAVRVECASRPHAADEEHEHRERNYLARTFAELESILSDCLAGSPPPADTDRSYLPHGLSDGPWEIDIDAGRPGYAAMDQFLRQYAAAYQGTAQKTAPPVAAHSPQEVRDQFTERILKAMETAGLLGMGGAGARSWLKWTDVRVAPGIVKYIVCNGDESEPGTFKDREILLRAPHLVIEGMMLAGIVTGAQQGYVYIRHEYEEQIAAVRAAIQDAERSGLLGARLAGTDFTFQLEVFVSPGGYICGEQSALIEAMENKRAEPRNRPPELQTNGLWDKPTLLSNVETFSWVPAIVRNDDGRWFAEQNRPGCKGRRIFSLSGDVERPGVYEVPNGIFLGELIAQAGGMRGGKPLLAFAPSGPSCGFLPAKFPVKSLPPEWVQKHLPAGAEFYDLLDLPLDFNIVRGEMKLMLGAGLMVIAEGVDMLEQAQVSSEFFRNESCGKCVPCRLGSQKMVQFGRALLDGRVTREEFEGYLPAIRELSKTMEKTSICGLGQVASNPLSSVLNYFPQHVERVLAERESLDRNRSS